MTDEMRTFGTGATRHSEEGKFDYQLRTVPTQSG